MPVFYTPKLEKDSEELSISGVEYNHIYNSSRKTIDEKITLSNGNGILAEGIIKNISENAIIVRIKNTVEKLKSRPHIALAFSLLKKNNDFIIQKCTELGVYEFFPFVSNRTIKKNFSEKLNFRLNKIAISAMKQSDSSFLPTVHETIKFPDLFDKINNSYSPILAWEGKKNKLLHETLQETEKDICLIIGPEGGFASKEVNLATNNNAEITGLGNHILRAETAAISSVANTSFYFFQSNSDFY